MRDSKFSYVYKTHDAFKADAYGWAIKSNLGFIPNLILDNDVRDEEPILSPEIKCMAVLEGQGHITNPLGYVSELLEYSKKTVESLLIRPSKILVYLMEKFDPFN